MNTENSEYVWRKSSWSRSGNCLEAASGRKVYVRDSKDPHREILKFSRKAWREFVSAVSR